MICDEEKSDFQIVLESAKEAIASPILFFQFVENIEHLSDKLYFMSDHQRQNYPILWWGLQEIHLTSLPAWLDAGEPKDWTGWAEYQQQAVEGINLFTSLMIGNYLIAVQKLVDTINLALKNDTDLLGFANNIIYNYEYRFDLLSQYERCKLRDICSYIERFASTSKDGSGDAANLSRIVYECKEFIDLLKEHKRDIEHKHWL